MHKFDPLPTFSHLRQHPEDLPEALSSPITHQDGTITVLWEGNPDTAIPMCVTEWLATPRPLEQLPGTSIWGVDLDAPPLPPTICSYVRVMIHGKVSPSPRHHPDLRGPDLPPLLSLSSGHLFLAEDIVLPAPGLAGDARRVRVYVPHDYHTHHPYPALFWLDAQSAIDQLHWLPGLPETLWLRGEMPPMIVVAMDHGGQARPEEYLADEQRNPAARAWVWNTILPYIIARYPLDQCWLVGVSNAASMALQLMLAKPGVFAGGLFLSPRHRKGLEAVLALAEHWPGGGHFFLGQGDFGLGEQQAVPDSQMLAKRLQEHRANVHFVIKPGYGHTFDAFFLLLIEGLRWLFRE
ncbi:MAG TPA: alpha/beta hydrolase-fold protein [Ktedonobacteraceae bacterium]|jgi:enterochelin esterase-like enzyme|nr:alpha/beta hydrolase-fold protein [Ktedonobacteraceae bacterium]